MALNLGPADPSATSMVEARPEDLERMHTLVAEIRHLDKDLVEALKSSDVQVVLVLSTQDESYLQGLGLTNLGCTEQKKLAHAEEAAAIPEESEGWELQNKAGNNLNPLYRGNSDILQKDPKVSVLSREPSQSFCGMQSFDGVINPNADARTNPLYEQDAGLKNDGLENYWR
ncbi:hypothetical protein CYMTET_53387 [Cymbomonas tetramitiformis]|uniref:Uncharacterized protein n=1 Tax=Cymbomonas tetramitiformis TaxID=36881 RepID=A0AAE0BHA9_9CHLO|nr:hypothetical protein CYMTET_53387 [Cymbomonas tetramitiformis]